MTVRARPKGVPNAITSWPTTSVAAIAQFGGAEGDFFLCDFVHVHLDDGQIGPVIVADQMGGDAFLVGQRDINLDGPAGDVVVGEDAALLIDDDARAVAALRLLAVVIDRLGNVDAHDGGRNAARHGATPIGRGGGVGRRRRRLARR